MDNKLPFYDSLLKQKTEIKQCVCPFLQQNHLLSVIRSAKRFHRYLVVSYVVISAQSLTKSVNLLLSQQRLWVMLMTFLRGVP